MPAQMINPTEFFATKLYPLLTNGKHTVIITAYKAPVETEKKDKSKTYYVPISMQLETGRPITYNVFEDQWLGRFIGPIQTQVNPDNDQVWESQGEFLNDLIENKTPIDCWLEKVNYLSATGVKTTWNYNFAEPIEEVAPKNAPAQSTPAELTEAESEAVNF